MRIYSVNSDHLWSGKDNGMRAALTDFKESGEKDSEAEKVVKLKDVETLIKALKTIAERGKGNSGSVVTTVSTLQAIANDALVRLKLK